MSVEILSANTARLTRTASVLDCTTDYTMAGWFKFYTMGDLRTFFWVGEDGGASNEHWSSLTGTANPTRLRIQSRNTTNGGTAFQDSSASNTLGNGRWVYVAMRRNGVNHQLAIGFEDVAVSQWINIAAASPQVAGTRMNIGTRITSQNLINGLVIYCRAWTVALTDAELDAEAISTSAARTDGLWADWPLTVHTDLTDVSGNGRNWTAVNTIATSTDIPAVFRRRFRTTNGTKPFSITNSPTNGKRIVITN